jgi:hypothetical protein
MGLYPRKNKSDSGRGRGYDLYEPAEPAELFEPPPRPVVKDEPPAPVMDGKTRETAIVVPVKYKGKLSLDGTMLIITGSDFKEFYNLANLAGVELHEPYNRVKNIRGPVRGEDMYRDQHHGYRLVIHGAHETLTINDLELQEGLTVEAIVKAMAYSTRALHHIPYVSQTW